MTGISSSREDIAQNIFYPRLANIATEVCSSCPLGVCPFGKFRPAMSEGGLCGPPCGLLGKSCLEVDGCIQTCTGIPTGAQISGAVSGINSTCPWTCLPTWHLNGDGGGCMRCTDTVCDQNFAMVPLDQCMTYHTNADLCKPCLPVVGGTPSGWDVASQACTYTCSTGFYPTTYKSLGCSSCYSSFSSSTQCPIGTFRDVQSCLDSQVEPQCRACSLFPDQLNAISFTTNGGTSELNCSGMCNAGYNTIWRNNRSVVEYVVAAGGGGLPTSQISCLRCKVGEDVTCKGKCSAGFFRNLSVVSDYAHGACSPCTTNAQCGAGKYAPLCSGNGTSNVGCYACNSSFLWQDGELVREFVPYDVRQLFVVYSGPSYDACPSACIANYIQDSASPKRCISCRNYLKRENCESLKSPSSPQPCDFVYSHWNATPAEIWWPSQTPSSFSTNFFMLPAGYVKKEGVKYNRAGLCWACPVGTGTLPGDDDLCLVLPGYGRQMALPERIPIPTLGKDLYLVSPPLSFIIFYNIFYA